jgi:hypothetical protein
MRTRAARLIDRLAMIVILLSVVALIVGSAIAVMSAAVSG